MKSVNLTLTHPKTFYFILFAIYLLAIINQNNFTINWDVSWLMHVSQNMLAGGSYYKDFMEINPPLILYLYTPPVLLAKLFSINIIYTLRAYMFLLATLSLTLCYSLLIKIFKQQDEKIFAIFFFALTLGFLILPFQQFGQREHLSIILGMPYLFLTALRLQDGKPTNPLAVLIGLLAALGFGVKMHFLVPLILVEIYYLILSRKLSSMLKPEAMTLVAVLILYVLAVIVFQPEYFNVIPIAVRSFYQAYQSNILLLLLNQLNFCCYFSLLLFFIQYRTNPYKVLSSILALAMCGYFIAFLIPRILWAYHATPFYIMAILLSVLQLGIVAQYPASTKRETLLLTLFAIGVAFFLESFAGVAGIFLIFHPVKFYLFHAILFAALLLLAKPDKNWLKMILMLSSIIGTGFIFSYLNQRSAWNHYRYFLTLGLFAVLFSLFIPGNYKNKYAGTVAAALAMLMLCFPFYYATELYHTALDTKKITNSLTEFLQAHAKHKTVYYFTNWSVILQPAISFAEADFYGHTQDSGWVPAVLNRNNQDPLLAHDKDFYISLVVKDLNLHKPEYIFVDLDGSKYIPVNLHFSYLTFFSQNAGFREAWKAYRYLTTLTENESYHYEIYQRVS